MPTIEKVLHDFPNRKFLIDNKSENNLEVAKGLAYMIQDIKHQVMFTFDLAADLKESEIMVNCLHPASLMDTKMVFDTDYFGSPMSTVDEGTAAVEYLAASTDLDGVSGEYFDGRQRSRANPQAYDKHAQRQLRMLSEQLTHLRDL
jgi:hypothetical protein